MAAPSPSYLADQDDRLDARVEREGCCRKGPQDVNDHHRAFSVAARLQRRPIDVDRGQGSSYAAHNG